MTLRSTFPRLCLIFAFLLATAAQADELPDRSSLDSAPYPASPLIRDMVLRWATHKRHAQGSDNFQLTWADDDHLYGAWGDGGGFGGSNSMGRVDLGVARIEGPAANYRGFNVWGGHAAENPATFSGKSWAMISVDGSLYCWVVPDKPDGKSYRNHYEYVELATSHDHGANWTKAAWRFEQAELLTIPTFLNFGKDNSGVPAEFGDYVYTYFIAPQNPSMEQQGPKGVNLVVHKPGKLYLARVAKGELLHSKSSYEFFQGTDAHDQPRWGSLAKKRPVFEDANGVGWCLSASYSPHLERIVLCTEHGTSSQGRLGFFDAPAPWGPWTTVIYHDADRPFGMTRDGSNLAWRNNVFFAALPTKWLAGDCFTLIFTGAGQGKDNDSLNTIEGSWIRR